MRLALFVAFMLCAGLGDIMAEVSLQSAHILLRRFARDASYHGAHQTTSAIGLLANQALWEKGWAS